MIPLAHAGVAEAMLLSATIAYGVKVGGTAHDGKS
jgi:hypothetical protein